MKDQHDTKTLEIPVFPVPRRPGRPKTGNALTPAQKQAAYRARKAAKLAGEGGSGADVRTTYSREYVEGLERRIAALQALVDDLDARNASLFSKCESKDSHIKGLRREQTRLQGLVDELLASLQAAERLYMSEINDLRSRLESSAAHKIGNVTKNTVTR